MIYLFDAQRPQTCFHFVHQLQAAIQYMFRHAQCICGFITSAGVFIPLQYSSQILRFMALHYLWNECISDR